MRIIGLRQPLRLADQSRQVIIGIDRCVVVGASNDRQVVVAAAREFVEQFLARLAGVQVRKDGFGLCFDQASRNQPSELIGRRTNGLRGGVHNNARTETVLCVGCEK